MKYISIKTLSISIGIVLVIGLIIIYLINRTGLPNLSNKELLDKFNKNPSYDISLDNQSASIKGSYSTPKSFQGDYYTKAKGTQTDKPDYKIVVVDDKKQIIDSQDKAIDNPNFLLIETNIISHPEYINVLEPVSREVADNITYIKYNVIFEKTDPDINKSVPPDIHSDLVYRGYILVNEKTKILKKLVLSQKSNPSEITIDYTALNKKVEINLPAN